MKNGKARTAQILSFAIVGVLFAAPTWSETKFVAASEVSATWVDNINLSPEDSAADPKLSEYVFQVNPGFVFEQTGQRFNSSLSYTMQNFYYLEDSDRNSTYHQGDLNATLAMVKDYFFLQASGNYSQQVIDPKKESNNNLLFANVAVTDTLTAQVSPYFHHEFDSVRADVRYTRGIVNYDEPTYTARTDAPNAQPQVLQDVETEGRYATFGSADEQARLSWEARYAYQEAQYDSAPPFRFESASLELGILLGKGFRLIGRGGLESDAVRDTTEAGLDESYWDAGFRWRPNQYTLLEAMYGEHAFGETYTATVERTARLLTMRASYSEGPTTQAQEMVLRPVAGGEVQTGVAPGSGMAPATESFNSITADVYLREDAEASIAIKGQRTEIDLGAFQFKRTYISGARNGATEQTRGGSVGLKRTLSSNLALTFDGSYAESLFEVGQATPLPGVATPQAYEFHDVMLNLGLTEKVSERVGISLNANRMRRTGGIDYTAHWVTLSIKGEF